MVVIAMQRGIIGCAEGAFSRVEPMRKARFEDSEELIDQIDVTSVKRTPDGLDINQGVAASQKITDTMDVTLNGGGIESRETTELVTRYTEFLAVPDEFVAVDSKTGRFLFELLSQDTETEFSRATVDLQGVLDDELHDSVWKVGYFDPDDPSRNGVVHGEEVLRSGEYDDQLASTEPNQLGMTLTVDGENYKVFLTQSGYLDIYRPRDLEPEEFASFIQEVVLPHAD